MTDDAIIAMNNQRQALIESDGNPKHRPDNADIPSTMHYREATPQELYKELEKIWKQWSVGNGKDKVHLPKDYALYYYWRDADTRSRMQIWGHSEGGEHFYDSANEFRPHLEWLSSNRREKCACKWCEKKKE